MKMIVSNIISFLGLLIFMSYILLLVINGKPIVGEFYEHTMEALFIIILIPIFLVIGEIMKKEKKYHYILSYLVSFLGLFLALSYFTIEALEGAEVIEEIQTHPLETFFIILQVPLFFMVGELLRRNYKVQEELSQTSQKLKTLLDHLPEIIFTLDERGRIVTLNETFEKKLKFNKERWLGKEVVFIMEGENKEKINNLIERARRGEDYTEVINVNSFDGRRLYFSVRLYYLREYGEFIGIASDITQIKLMEEIIEKNAQKIENTNELLKLFIDIISHDIVNPLGIVGGYLEVLQSSEDEKNQETYSIMKTYLDKAVEISTNTKKYSKFAMTEDIELKEINVSELLAESIEEIKHYFDKKNIKLKAEFPEKIIVKGHEILKEAFINILNNAVKYSEEGTEVTVGAEETENSWVIYFADQGRGVPDEHKEDIFERFTRVKKGGVKGTGLGLAIVKRVVELHKGRVWVEDNKPKGSIFKIELPKA